MLMLLTLAIMAGGYFVFQHYKAEIKKDKQGELAGIAELKIGQITTWMTERRGDAQAISKDTLFIDAAWNWLQHGGPADEAKARLIGRLTSLQQAYAAYGYISISLVDDQAMLRLSSSKDEMPIQGIEKLRLLECMKNGQIVMSELHREKLNKGDRLEIELRVPLTVVRDGAAHSIGALLFRIDPERFLFPLIQRWPTSSLSAETTLVRRDGIDVVFLNQLRHSNNIPLEMRLPLSQRDLLATKAVMGEVGLVDGIDYRGVPVVGVLNKVEGTSWFLVSKMDRAEIYAPIDRLANWMLSLMLVVVGAGGGIVAFWWQKKKQQHERDLEYQRLVKHRDYLVKYANDIILLLDDTGKVADFNDRALDALGYSADELSKLNIDDLRAIGFSISSAERFAKIEQAGGALTFESMFARKNRTHFPIEVSVRAVNIEGEKFYQSIIRDITERRRAEDELTRQRRFFRQVIDSDPNFIFVKDGDGRFLLANAAFAKSYGQSTDSIIGKKTSELDHDASRVAAYESAHREVLENSREREAIEQGVTSDGETHWFKTVRKPLEQADGEMGVLTIAMDITQQKLAEIKLAVSYNKLQRLSLHLENIRLDERRKIALNLHDEMGATLAALKMGAVWLASRLPDEMPQLSAEVAQINELTSEGIRIMHQIVAQLRPNLLADVGLTAAIKDYVKKFQQRTGIECTLVLPDDELALDEDQSVTIYRILQEALSNVLKHAQAQSVTIRVIQRSRSLLMIVTDHGIGFDTSLRKEHVFGLLGIRERALMVGGRARISSAPGKGVRVWVSIPCPPDG